MADWREVLQRHPEKARETILRPLLANRIVLKPRVTSKGRFFEFTAPVSFGGLVTGLIGTRDGVVTVVPPGVVRRRCKGQLVGVLSHRVNAMRSLAAA